MATQIKGGQYNLSPTSLRDFGAAMLLFCAIIAAYLPALNGGLLWDDSGHVTKQSLQSVHGLFRIWFELGATQQYYPLLHSAFWVEHRMWGDAVLGYHLTNVTLHAVSALLVVAIMRRLSLPGAWLGGFIFALHPVCTESVAWISEQKNTLSTVFYLGSALCYLRFDRERRQSRYFLALALYALALMSKSVTATLPATLLVILWWERGTLSWKRDVLPLLPWFGLAAASGFLTAWVEHEYIGAHGASFDLTLGQRCLLAGRVIWFYFGKLFWPSNLTFIYPHWTIDTGVAWQYLFPFGTIAMAVGFWMYWRKNRGPLAAFLCFTGALAPALGFVNVYPFIYSYVADHFQYQASLAIIIPVAAGLTIAAGRLPSDKRRFAAVPAVLLVLGLGLLTWRQAAMYRDEVTLYRETIARNPACWLAYNNLGIILTNEPGRASEAMRLFGKVLEVQPDNAEARVNLGNVLVDMPGRFPEAVAYYREAIRLMPGLANAHLALAHSLSTTPGGLAEALTEYQNTIRIQPGNSGVHTDFGAALSRMPGRLQDAIAEYRRAVELDSLRAESHYDLAYALGQVPGRAEEEIAEYRAAIQIRPEYAEAHMNLGAALLKTPGETDKAMAEFQTALRIRPHYAEAHYNLGTVLADMPGRVPEAIAEYEAALRDKPDYAQAHCNLGVALAEIPGRMPDAMAQFEAALRSDPNMAEAQYGWGVALANIPGRGREAIAHFREALRLRPDFEPARQVLARLGMAQ